MIQLKHVRQLQFCVESQMALAELKQVAANDIKGRYSAGFDYDYLHDGSWMGTITDLAAMPEHLIKHINHLSIAMPVSSVYQGCQHLALNEYCMAQKIDFERWYDEAHAYFTIDNLYLRPEHTQKILSILNN